MEIRIFVLLIIFQLPITVLFSENPATQFQIYKNLNDAEIRYTEYKDSDDMLKIKITQLNYINEGRAQYNAPPVKLDILASRVANKMSREAAESDFRGHWNTRGEKPYHRNAFAGGVDHVMENAASQWTSGSFKQSLETNLTFMKDSNDRFMAETAPNDGHKQNCINLLHNYVGIGSFLADNQFRYYEEFIDRYLLFDNVPGTVSQNENFSIKIKPINENQTIYYALVYFEPPLTPLTPTQINRKGSYGDYSSDTILQSPPWEIPDPDSNGWYNFDFSFSGKGLYYLQIYISETPWTGGSASTEGKIQGSGVVIRVE